MKKIISALLSALFLLPMLPLSQAMAAQEEVNVYNWEDYISEEALALFEEETGIRVNYLRFTTNEDMLVQIHADPTNYDVIFPSDYVIERLINEDLLEEIDFANVPNAAQTLDWLKSTDYDPGMKYSVPYMWGTVGIVYNSTMVKEPITSWQALWDTDYVDSVFMMDSIRDTIGVTLKMLGYSMNTRDTAALEMARDKLIEQKKQKIVKAYQVDETKDKMIAGEAAMGLMWSGDAAYAIGYNSDLVYVVPEEGSNVWVDAMCIPKGAKNKANAEKFIDFMSRPEIALLNFEEILFCTPNAGTIELIDEELRADTTLFPEQAVLDTCEFFHDISQDIRTYEAIWMAVKSAR